MRVLVTGGAGFLGRHFVERHHMLGHDVWVVDDLSNPESRSYWYAYASDPTFWRETDVRYFTQEALRMAYEFDLVYHFAAPVGGRLKIDGDPMYNADSLSIDAALFRWAANDFGPKQIVYPSSSAVYGTELQNKDAAQALPEWQFEPDKWAWYAPDQMYGFTKLAGEYLAWKAADYGVHTLCIRPFSGYGEGQSFDYPVPSIAARALRREDPLTIWGSGSQTRDFIHVDDIVDITTLRLAQGFAGYQTLNLGSGVETTFRQVAEICAEIVGYEPEIVTDESKPQGVTRRFADTNLMRRHYSEELISLRDGLTRVLADVEQRLAIGAGT